MVNPTPQSGSWYADRIAASTAPMMDAMTSPSPMVSAGTSRVIMRSSVLRTSRSKISAIFNSMASRWPDFSPTASRWIASCGNGADWASGSASPRPSLTAVVVSVSASRRTAFAESSPGDRERVEKRHTVGQQGAERPREARRVDLDQQAAEERHA